MNCADLTARANFRLRSSSHTESASSRTAGYVDSGTASRSSVNSDNSFRSAASKPVSTTSKRLCTFGACIPASFAWPRARIRLWTVRLVRRGIGALYAADCTEEVTDPEHKHRGGAADEELACP